MPAHTKPRKEQGALVIPLPPKSDPFTSSSPPVTAGPLTRRTGDPSDPSNSSQSPQYNQSPHPMPTPPGDVAPPLPSTEYPGGGAQPLLSRRAPLGLAPPQPHVPGARSPHPPPARPVWRWRLPRPRRGRHVQRTAPPGHTRGGTRSALLARQ